MKRMIAALVLGIIIGSASSTFAAVGDSITAIFSDANIKIEGQEVRLESSPANINGSLYLPLRETANLLGYDVTYKADSKTVEFTEGSEVKSLDTTTTREDSSEQTMRQIEYQITSKKDGIEFNKKMLAEAEAKLAEQTEYLKSIGASEDEISSDFTVRAQHIAIDYSQEQIDILTNELAQLEAEKAALEQE